MTNARTVQGVAAHQVAVFAHAIQDRLAHMQHVNDVKPVGKAGRSAKAPKPAMA